MIERIATFLSKLFSQKRSPTDSSVSRFILSKRHFSKEKNIVKHGAFLPIANSASGRLETSVFQTSGLRTGDIWKIGVNEVANKSGKNLYGRADVKTWNVEPLGLSVIPDDQPPRHANITGWPETRSEQKLFAIKLAADAELFLLRNEKVSE